MINADMRKFTTYRLKGIIKEVVYPKNTLELTDVLKKLKGQKHMVLGNGSNVVFTSDYDGTIIKLDHFDEFLVNDDEVTVGAGYSLIKLALKTANMGLSGLEFASGIPGTVGGSVYGNAGAYKKDMASVIKEVTILNSDLKVQTLSLEQMAFGYRKSILQENNFICLKAIFKLEHKNRKEILDVIKKRKEKRKISQPLEYPSAGSVFRNPDGDYAGRIIEQLGFKGKNVGDAFVSLKHANFIINKGNACGKDIETLVNLIKKEAFKKYNINLVTEQEFIE
ncbi:MAG: UDP-N-acetylmuramate dehydrogenase [Bacilli bacterium]|nr:UDP-N-acetylmuramate dehydrogenase [Bacilli bacterium]